MTSNIFDLTRFTHLMQREMKLSYKTLLLVSGVVFGLIIIGNVMNSFMVEPHSNGFDTESLITSLGFLGIIWASISFNELGTTSGRQFYLSIPSSHVEKLSSKWLNISVLIPLTYIIAFIITSYIATWIVNLFVSGIIPSPSYDWDTILTGMTTIFLCQSIFYMGSIIWPKYSLLKTILAIICVSIIIGIITSFVGRIIFHEYFQQGSYVISDKNFNFNSDLFFNNIPYLGKILSYALYIFFMLASYFKLKEKEL